MKNISTQKERIIQFIEYKGISKNKFYIKTGISNGVLDKKSGLSMDTVEKFYSSFPEVNPEWLLTGKGEMLKRENENQEPNITLHYGNRKTRDSIAEIQEIPLYNLEATAGLVELFKGEKATQVLETIKIPNLPVCDGALSVTGDSMYPLLKSGDIVMYKEIPVSFDTIFFGEMYLLGVMIDQWEEMITVKYVQKSEREGYVRLVSQNQHHQPKDIPISKITAMAIVKASIRFNTMY